MNHEKILGLDQAIHAPIRLAVMSILITVDDASFTFLRESTKTTDGNLSTHLSKLEKAGYITVMKSFKGKRPHTTCSVTRKGRKAFDRYLEQLGSIVKKQKQY
jgi:DNA-binding MarR family transcriptional regulator